MSYIHDNLKEGEELLSFNRYSKIHVSFYVVLIMIIVSCVSFIVIPQIIDPDKSPTIFIFLVFTVPILLTALWAALYYYAFECAVTNNRVIQKSGLIARNVVEMDMQSIESINVKQGIIGRIFGYGTVIISGRGTGDVNFLVIPKPVAVRQLIDKN